MAGDAGVKVEGSKEDIKLCVVSILLLINAKPASNTGNGSGVN